MLQSLVWQERAGTTVSICGCVHQIKRNWIRFKGCTDIRERQKLCKWKTRWLVEHTAILTWSEKHHRRLIFTSYITALPFFKPWPYLWQLLVFNPEVVPCYLWVCAHWLRFPDGHGCANPNGSSAVLVVTHMFALWSKERKEGNKNQFI